MKKIFTAVILFVSLLISGSAVYAAPATDTEQEFSNMIENRIESSETYSTFKQPNFEETISCLEKVSINWFEKTGEPITWAVCSLNNCKNFENHIFYNGNYERCEQLINSGYYDYVQIGTLLDISTLEATKEAFEEDTINAAINEICIRTSDLKHKEVYNEIIKNNIPIYWNIVETDSEVFILEIGIGNRIVTK